MRKRRGKRRNKVVPIILLMCPILGAIDGFIFIYSVSDVLNITLNDYLYWIVLGTVTGLEISFVTIVIIAAIKYLIKILKN